MGVKLGPERLKRAAQLLGIGAYDTPSEALRGRKLGFGTAARMR